MARSGPFESNKAAMVG